MVDKTGRSHVTWDTARAAREQIELAVLAECERHLARMQERQDRRLAVAILALTTAAACVVMVAP